MFSLLEHPQQRQHHSMFSSPPFGFYSSDPYGDRRRMVALENERRRLAAIQRERDLQRQLREAYLRQQLARERLARRYYGTDDEEEGDYDMIAVDDDGMETKDVRQPHPVPRVNATDSNWVRTPSPPATPPTQPARHKTRKIEITDRNAPAAPQRPLTPPSPTPAAAETCIPIKVTQSPSPQKLQEAATVIQTWYRAAKLRKASLKKLAALESRLQELESAITTRLPAALSTIEFNDSGALVIGAKGNIPLLSIEEDITKIMIAADSVESGGDEGIRDQRRSVIKRCSTLAATVEAGRTDERERRQRLKQQEEDGAAAGPTDMETAEEEEERFYACPSVFGDYDNDSEMSDAEQS